ncbi:MAG TPA: AMP-binding protein, partial [Vicinamibacteria bacterium]|nr:AMP-binding protein [Vicinamibacteria bacterium]
NCPEWIFAMFALARIGAVHVPVNTRLRVEDVGYVLRQSDATTLITHDVSGPVDYLAMARAVGPARLLLRSEARHDGAVAWPDVLAAGLAVPESALRARAAAVRPTDTAFIMYTSGTTGFPKGVMRDHSLVRSTVDRLRRLRTTEADVIVNYLPLFHIFGYVDGPLSTMLGGHRQVLTEAFDADEALDLVEREGGTQLHGFETHVKALVDAQAARPRDLRTLRTGIFAMGMASAAPIGQRARRVLAPLRHVTAYGITEAGANVAMSDIDATEEQACETSGYPCEGFELRAIDPETGRDRPPGVAGELVVRTRYLMQGYYRKPEETARAIDADGWFHTGDMAILRPDGYMRFVGRYKDMLKVGGENVDPMEVEAHLAHHPGVHEVAVVGLPDARLAEVPVAFVLRAPGADVVADELIAACRGRIASFKIPRHVVFVEALPTTSSGKVQKAVLREEALRRLGGG